MLAVEIVMKAFLRFDVAKDAALLRKTSIISPRYCEVLF